MSWQEVVAQGNINQQAVEAKMTAFQVFYGHYYCWFWIALAVIGMVIAVVKFLDDSPDISFAVIFGILVGGLIGGVVGMFLFGAPSLSIYYENFDKVQAQMVQDWKTNIAIPYIESLPQEKYEVKYIKPSPEMESKISGGRYFISTDVNKMTVLTFSYVEDKNGEKTLQTTTDWAKADMGLTKESEPFVQLRELNHDLGNGMDAGLYDIRVSIPESYKFDTMK